MKALGVIDAIVPEPLGGAHRDQTAAISSLGTVCSEQLQSMQSLDAAALIADRSDKYLAMGDKALA
jgi:acetyl-CoA carboxylase carboxyl transferase subunit alpha